MTYARAKTYQHSPSRWTDEDVYGWSVPDPSREEEMTDSEFKRKTLAVSKHVEMIMERLPKTPKEFSNGAGYLQHTSDVFECKHEFHELMKDFYCVDDLSFPMIGRYADDGGQNSFMRAWSRFMCVDDKLREWDQQYYKIHPDDAKQIKLN